MGAVSGLPAYLFRSAKSAAAREGRPKRGPSRCTRPFIRYVSALRSDGAFLPFVVQLVSPEPCVHALGRREVTGDLFAGFISLKRLESLVDCCTVKFVSQVRPVLSKLLR